MPDPVAPVVDAPEAPAEVVPEKKAEDKKPLLDSSKPLRGQVDKILENMPPVEEEEKEAEKPEEVPEPAKEEPEEEETVNNIPESEPEVEPVELPPWQKYVLDNLPTIQTVGHVEGGKDKIYTVKRVEELPENFEFTDKRAELTFSAALASQEVNARELLNKYQADEQQQKYTAFKNQEAVDIQADIKVLQKEGVLEKFKYDSDAPEFNDDPAVKEANAIYDLYKKTNDSYMKDGRTYRITYEDAAYKYLGMRSRQAPAKPETKVERDGVASKVSAPQSAAPDAAKKGMPIGSSMQDVLKLYKLGRI